jgi:hypothetical protein
MICVVGPNLAPEAIRLAELAIVKANSVLGIFPVVGDILEPIPGLRLVVRARRFEMREKPYLWLETEVVL